VLCIYSSVLCPLLPCSLFHALRHFELLHQEQCLQHFEVVGVAGINVSFQVDVLQPVVVQFSAEKLLRSFHGRVSYVVAEVVVGENFSVANNLKDRMNTCCFRQKDFV